MKRALVTSSLRNELTLVTIRNSENSHRWAKSTLQLATFGDNVIVMDAFGRSKARLGVSSLGQPRDFRGFLKVFILKIGLCVDAGHRAFAVFVNLLYSKTKRKDIAKLVFKITCGLTNARQQTEPNMLRTISGRSISRN